MFFRMMCAIELCNFHEKYVVKITVFILALAVPGTLTGSVTESPDYTSVTLTATLTGGSPTAHTFMWTLSDGTVMSPGLNIDGYMASQAQVGDVFFCGLGRL